MKKTMHLLGAIAVLMIGMAAPVSAEDGLTFFVNADTNLDGIKAVAQAFTKKTGIPVTFDIGPGGAEGENVVKTRLAAGEFDDITFQRSGSLFQALNPARNFVDLAAEPFMASVINSFKSTVSVGAKVYAVPAETIMGGGWYYNKKVYAQLGLKVPKTWIQLLANLEKIKAAKITPVIASYKDSWTAQLLILADYYNVQAKVPSFAQDYTAHKATFANTPAALRGFEKLAEIQKKGYINKDATSVTYDQAQKLLMGGKGAHYPMLTFATANLAALDPSGINDIGFFAQPGDSEASNGLTLWMPAGLSIWSGSKKVEEAKKFLAYYISPEGLAVNMTAKKPDGPWAVKGIPLPSDMYSPTKDLIPYIDNGFTAPALEFLSPIKGPNLPQISVQTGLGLKTPLDNAKEYDKDVTKQAKQLGLAGW